MRSLFFLLFFCTHLMYAQADKKIIAVAKFNPSMFFDPDNTITVGSEVLIKGHWTFQQEIGWGNNLFNLWLERRARFPDKNNWRFKTQIRCYFQAVDFSKSQSYWAIEYYRKDNFISQFAGIGQECNPLTGACAYFEEGILKTHRRVSALHFKIGHQWVLSEKMQLDFYFGGGVRGLVIKNNASDAITTLINNSSAVGISSTTRPGIYPTFPTVTFGFTLGYLITKQQKNNTPAATTTH
jgi:Protein of unknown function (DUF3575)